MSELSFSDVKGIYSSKYYICEKMGRVYDVERNDLSDICCMRWECVDCRPLLKSMLFVDVLNAVYTLDLNNHFIITFGGKKMREEYSWQESYFKMNNEWKKFSCNIVYHFGGFNYVIFPRSQNDGYCHYHILTDKYIPRIWIEERKDRYGFGFTRIGRNVSVADYLLIDYWDDKEWMIPFGVRHYRSSRSVVLNNYGPSNFNKRVFKKDFGIDDIEHLVRMLYHVDLDVNGYYVKKLLLFYKRLYRKDPLSKYYC